MTRINPLVALLSGLIILFTPSWSGATARPMPMTARPPDPRFGAIETYDASAAASEMGAGWTRIPFLWAQMQPNGTHEWIPPLSDEELAREIAQGRQPVGLVITTPAWATDMGIGPGVPYGLHTGHNDPNNLWANFVRQLIATYAGRIDHWIIWNEPDVWDANHPGYTWGGSVDDFLQLQRVAYLTIKEASAGAKVIFSGTSYWWDAAYGRELYFRQYLDALVQDLSAPGNNYYSDAIALHVYFQPDFVYSITALYHQLMREHGFDKPIWIVETNAAPSLDPQTPAPNGQFAITLDEQAAYIVQAFAMGIAGGATRIGVFKMIDTPSDLVANPEPFGLVRADGSRRPAFYTYRVAATYLAGFQGGQLEQRSDVSIVTIPRTQGTTTVLWTRTPSPVTVQIPAHAGSATLVDMWNNRRAIFASDGVYTVSLPGASCTHGPPCLIGGAPYMIVEGSADVAPPPSSAQESPDDKDETDANAGQTLVDVPPTATAVPEFSVNLQRAAIMAARDRWRKRRSPGYQIDLVAGPPFHLYGLTVVDNVVTEAQQSLAPLVIDLDVLVTEQGTAPLSTTMTFLDNPRDLTPYTIAGWFDRLIRYYEEHPSSPACDTQVLVHLDVNWGFPSRIEERWADDCQAEEEPFWMGVVAFATLTPSAPAPTPTATPAPTSTSTATFTPLPSPTMTASPTTTATSSPSPTVPASPTPFPRQATSGGSVSLWVVALAGLGIAGTFLVRRNNRNTKHKT